MIKTLMPTMNIVKDNTKLFIVAGILSLLSVLWMHMQVSSISPSDPQAIYNLAQNRMMVDLVQQMFVATVLWVVVYRASKKHVQLSTSNMLGLFFKSTLWFCFALFSVLFAGAMIAVLLGFEPMNMNQSELVELNQKHADSIVLLVNLVWGALLLWACFAVSVFSVRSQVRKLKRISPLIAKNLNKPSLLHAVIGFSPEFSPIKMPQVWILALSAIFLKTVAWYMEVSEIELLSVIGNIVQSMLPILFIIILESCFIALSNSRFSKISSVSGKSDPGE